MTTKGTTIIIGAGPGLGRALAETFAAEGHPVALLGRDEARLKELADDLNADGHTARSYVADAGDPGRLTSALHTAVEELGAPDVLIYNAAMLRADTPTDLGPEQLAASLAVNVTGAAAAVGAVLPMLRERKGSVLFTGGGFALYPSPEYTSLSVGKAALRAYAQSLFAHENAAGVNVATVTIRGTIQAGDPTFDPRRIAAAYLELHRRPKDQRQAELLYP